MLRRRGAHGSGAVDRRGGIDMSTPIAPCAAVPTDAEVTAGTAGRSVDECAAQVLEQLRDR